MTTRANKRKLKKAADRVARATEANVSIQAADLPPVPLPKVKKKQQSFPSYVEGAGSGADNSSTLNREDLRVANKDLLTFRQTASDTRSLLSIMNKVSPDLSGAVFSYVRAAVTPSWTLVARNLDTTLNPEATLLMQQLIARMDIIQNYEKGFSGSWDVRSVAESLAVETILHGSHALELVLDKARLPAGLAPISIQNIEFKPDDGNKGLKPVQVIGSDEVDLDIPTFFYTHLDQDLQEPYSNSPMEAAIQPMLADLQFFNDLRRILLRVIRPRMLVTIDEEKFNETIPEDIKNGDEEELAAYTQAALDQVRDEINDLSVDDAIVCWDFINISFIDHGTASPAEQERLVQEMAKSRTLAGSKTLPSILGHDSGSQNVASTQSVLYIKAVSGAVQEKLNLTFSRLFTLAARLFGHDVYCEFKFASIELRPESELEAFKAMKQSRILELLSLGFLTDEEACLILIGQLPPPGMTPLSGTGFHNATSTNENPYSPTGQAGDSSGALNQDLNPDTPAEPKS